MLGLHDLSIGLAYLLSIGSAVLCVVYGVIYWNRDGGSDAGEGTK